MWKTLYRIIYAVHFCQVWEVRAADLTISPVYHAAIGTVHPDKVPCIILTFDSHTLILILLNVKGAKTNCSMLEVPFF